MNAGGWAGDKPYEWPDGKKWAFAISADVDGESPFLWRNRTSQPRNIAEREQRRFGPTIGVFRLAALFAELSVPATFFVPSYIAETYPNIVPALVEQNFEVDRDLNQIPIYAAGRRLDRRPTRDIGPSQSERCVDDVG